MTTPVLGRTALAVCALAMPLAAQNYGGSLICNGPIQICITKIEIHCNDQGCLGNLHCPGKIATLVPNGPLCCERLIGPDATFSIPSIPSCLQNCTRVAYIFYTCDAMPQPAVCLTVPVPGSGMSTSADLTCGTTIEGSFVLSDNPLPFAYCVGKSNSLGCTPAIGFQGNAILSSPNPFWVTGSNVINDKSGLLFYGLAPVSVPFLGGTLCVLPPLQRTPIQKLRRQHAAGRRLLGDSGCSTMNAQIQGGTDPDLVVGVTVYAQYWGRDPGLASPNDVQLSNAGTFVILP